MDLLKTKKYFSLARYVLVPCLHLLVIFLVYQLLLLGGFIAIINPFFFKQWDAYWYANIAEQGYQFFADKPSNTAFFPLFPYVWKFLWKIIGAGVEGVSLYNLIVYILGMLILKKTFKFSWTYFLFFLSIPSNIFMYVPYSEATFFFFSSLIIAGLEKENRYMLLIGLFFASLTRPSAAFFIPALLCMETIAYKDFKTFAKNMLWYSAIPLIAVFCVFIFQYFKTGVWLAFFKDGWRREMQMPEFPITTWGGFSNLWLDGLALFFGILAVVLLLSFLYLKYRKRLRPLPEKSTVFSLAYVMMALLTILIFGGKDDLGGTSLLSLNRFLMATPYFTLMLFFISHKINPTYKKYIIYATLALISLALLKFNTVGYSAFKPQELVFYSFLMLANMLLFATISIQNKERFIPMLYLINVFTQVLLLYRFAYGFWVG
jgi:hypothetical protein